MVEIEAYPTGNGSTGFRVVTYMRLLKGSTVNGFYTAMYTDDGSQVLEHIGDVIMLDGVHQGGNFALHPLNPNPQTEVERPYGRRRDPFNCDTEKQK